MEQKGFSAGVLPGGLRGKQEIKILVCYMVNRFPNKLAKSDINNILQNYGLANYFETSQAFDEMVSAENIFKDENGLFYVSKSGEMIANELAGNLPLSVKEKAINGTEEYFKRVKSEKENKVTIKKNERGYDVTCSVLDGKFEMLKIKIYAPDIEAAMLIKNNFYKSPGNLYRNILAQLAAPED